MTGRASGVPPRVAILADDLIWATRLADGTGRAGAVVLPVRTAGNFDAVLPTLDGVVVDLTARAYDGLACLRAAGALGVTSVAVGQHDDAALRQAALEAGATRVFTYRALFEHGDRELAAWIAGLRGRAEAGR